MLSLPRSVAANRDSTARRLGSSRAWALAGESREVAAAAAFTSRSLHFGVGAARWAILEGCNDANGTDRSLLKASIGSPPASPRPPSHPSGGEGGAPSPSLRGRSFVLVRARTGGPAVGRGPRPSSHPFQAVTPAAVGLLRGVLRPWCEEARQLAEQPERAGVGQVGRVVRGHLEHQQRRGPRPALVPRLLDGPEIEPQPVDLGGTPQPEKHQG